MATIEPQLAVVEDEPAIRKALIKMIGHCGIEAVGFDSAEAFIRSSHANLGTVLTDVRLPGMSGIELLQQLQETHPETLVIVTSSYGTLDTAMEAIRLGAFDYLPKPIEPSQLKSLLDRIARQRTMQSGELVLADWDKPELFEGMVGESAGMRVVFSYISKVAGFDATILIQGESGSGKERVARAIHSLSKRSEKPFMSINCGAIPENLIESELFGVRKGAFTGADRDRTGVFKEADGGTLFLDEIGELPLQLQVKLLRVLQEGEIRPVGASQSETVDVRIIAASLRDISKLVAEKGFREDLYFRLNIMEISIPPLRHRRADIPPLCVSILNRISERYGREVDGIDAAAMDRFYRHPWPGNIRQLENVLERALILSNGPRITQEAVQLPPVEVDDLTRTLPSGSEWSPQSLSIKTESARLEQHLITKALIQTGGNQRKAADILDISPRALVYKIQQYEIRKEGDN